MQRYTIAGAQRVLKENGVRFVQAVGRGEAVAAEPCTRRRRRASAGALGAPDRAALADALEDLRACRALLDGLGRVADGEV